LHDEQLLPGVPQRIHLLTVAVVIAEDEAIVEEALLWVGCRVEANPADWFLEEDA
jgi:hypothetical protein